MEHEYTPGPWRPGKNGGEVVSDHPLPGYIERGINSGHDHVSYYGGYLIAESIWRKEDRDLIAAAPELLDALKNLLSAPQLYGEVGYNLALRIDAARAAITKATGENLGRKTNRTLPDQ